MSIIHNLVQYLLDLFKINTTITINNPGANTGTLELILMCVAQIGAVIIGGIITYYITKRFNERADVKQKEYQRRDDFYIPFCTQIEKVKESSYDEDGNITAQNIDSQDWIQMVNNADKYLKAEYRKHLTSVDKNDLVELKTHIVAMLQILGSLVEEGSNIVETNIKASLLPRANEILEKEFKLTGEPDLAINCESDLQEFILLGSVGRIRASCDLTYRSSDGEVNTLSIQSRPTVKIPKDNRFRVSLEMAEMVKSISSNDDEKIKDKIGQLIGIASNEMERDLESDLHNFVRYSNEKLIEHEKRILALLDTIYSRLIKEIDRITAIK